MPITFKKEKKKSCLGTLPKWPLSEPICLKRDLNIAVAFAFWPSLKVDLLMVTFWSRLSRVGMVARHKMPVRYGREPDCRSVACLVSAFKSLSAAVLICSESLQPPGGNVHSCSNTSSYREYQSQTYPSLPHFISFPCFSSPPYPRKWLNSLPFQALPLSAAYLIKSQFNHSSF